MAVGVKRTPLERRSRTKRPSPGRNDAYRAWIRQQSCCICGQSPCDPAHVKTWGSSRLDRANLVPLCRPHHMEQEGATRTFQNRYNVDLQALAVAYAEGWEWE